MFVDFSEAPNTQKMIFRNHFPAQNIFSKKKKPSPLLLAQRKIQ